MLNKLQYKIILNGLKISLKKKFFVLLFCRVKYYRSLVL